MTREAHEWDPPASAEPTPERAEAEFEERVADELKHLIKVVRFGIDVEAFLDKNPVGQYLVERAESDLNEAVRELLDLNSVRGKKARDIFARAKVAVSTLRFLNDAITAGLEAEKTLEAQDQVER